MNRILALIRRDLLSTSKDAVLVYILVAPLLMALAIRFFLPAVGQAAVNVVVTEEMDADRLATLEEYFNVILVSDLPGLERRVLAYDDTVGIVISPEGQYSLVFEGNETHDSKVLPEMVLQRITDGKADLPAEMVDLERSGLPFREIIAAMLVMGALIFPAVIMGLQIVEDKECRILPALGVSPLGRKEYVAGRSLLAMALGVAVAFASLWSLGVMEFNYLQMLAAILSASLMGVMFAFMIGALSSNQITGIATVKFGALALMLPPILTFLLPRAYWGALYWLPPFWAFVTFKTIVEGGVAWSSLWPMLAWNLGTGLVYAVVLYSWLKNRLDFARG